jgi:acyl carrier protein
LEEDRMEEISIKDEMAGKGLEELTNEIDAYLEAHGDELFAGFKECMTEVMGEEIDGIGLNDSLIEDLGAESLDLLDLVFRLEMMFKIRVPRGGIREMALRGLSEDEFEVEGCLTEMGAENLRRILPEVDPERITAGMYSDEIPQCFTCRTFLRLVVWRRIVGESAENE